MKSNNKFNEQETECGVTWGWNIKITKQVRTVLRSVTQTWKWNLTSGMGRRDLRAHLAARLCDKVQQEQAAHLCVVGPPACYRAQGRSCSRSCGPTCLEYSLSSHRVGLCHPHSVYQRMRKQIPPARSWEVPLPFSPHLVALSFVLQIIIHMYIAEWGKPCN